MVNYGGHLNGELQVPTELNTVGGASDQGCQAPGAYSQTSILA